MNNEQGTKEEQELIEIYTQSEHIIRILLHKIDYLKGKLLTKEKEKEKEKD